MRRRHNTALATTGGGYTRHLSAPLSPGAKWVGAAARGTRPRLPPRPAVGPVRCRQGAEERRRVPAAARLLARKELRRRAATEGNGKVNCARRHPRRGRRLRTPSKRSIRFRGWWSRATRSARAHVELFGVPGVTCVQDLPDGVLYPTPPLSARRVIAPGSCGSGALATGWVLDRDPPPI